MSLKFAYRSLLVFLLVIVGPLTVHAQSADAAKGVVRHMIREIQSKASFIDQDGTAVMMQYFDMRSFSKRCMADHWNMLTETQRMEFVDTFTRLLAGRLADAAAKHGGYRTLTSEVGAVIRSSDAIFSVPVSVSVGDATLAFVYYLMPEDGGFRLVDYEVEGVLLSRQYRGQFNYLMRTRGFDGMMERVRAKLQKQQRRFSERGRDEGEGAKRGAEGASRS